MRLAEHEQYILRGLCALRMRMTRNACRDALLGVLLSMETRSASHAHY